MHQLMHTSTSVTRIRILLGLAGAIAIALVILLLVTSLNSEKTTRDSQQPPNKATTLALSPVSSPAVTSTQDENTEATKAEANQRSSGNFYVVGSDIVDPDGNIFYPIGANAAVSTRDEKFVFELHGSITDHVGTVKAWNWNTIRVTLVCEGNQEMALERLKEELPKLTSQKIVAMVECHDATGTGPIPADKEAAIRQFWMKFAEIFKDNPYVWFNFYNEPYRGPADAAYTQIHQSYTDAVREMGAENIVVVDLPGYGQDLSSIADGDLGTSLKGDRCNMIFSWHDYGAHIPGAGNDGLRATFQKVRAKDLALLVGEFGVPVNNEAGHNTAGPLGNNIRGADRSIAVGPSQGVGLLWWHATGDSGKHLIYALTDDSGPLWDREPGEGLSEFGKKFWDASQAVDHNRPYTGEVTASNCPSAS